MPPGPEWKAQVTSKAFLDGSRLPTWLALLPGLLLRKWLKGWGASGHSLPLPLWARAAQEMTCCGFCCCIEDDQEKWEKQPTPRDATVPKAKETHQAQGGWMMGNLQHPKPPPSRLGSPGILGLQSQEESPQNWTTSQHVSASSTSSSFFFF